MKNLITGILAIFIPITAFADDQTIPTISSSCQIRSLPGGRDDSTIEYSWKITAKSTDDRVLSVEQLTRNEQASPLPDLRGYQRFMFCKAGSLHEKEIRLEVDQAPDGGERAYWFEGFLTSLINEDIPLSESAALAVTTREISDEKGSGHLIGVTVSHKGRELSRHYIFIRFMNLADAEASPIWRQMTEGQDIQDGNVYQGFTDTKNWEPRIRRFTELEK